MQKLFGIPLSLLAGTSVEWRSRSVSALKDLLGIDPLYWWKVGGRIFHKPNRAGFSCCSFENQIGLSDDRDDQLEYW